MPWWPSKPADRGQRPAFDLDDRDAQARGVEDQLLEGLATLWHDEQATRLAAGDERLLDRTPPGDQLVGRGVEQVDSWTEGHERARRGCGRTPGGRPDQAPGGAPPGRGPGGRGPPGRGPAGRSVSWSRPGRSCPIRSVARGGVRSVRMAEVDRDRRANGSERARSAGIRLLSGGRSTGIWTRTARSARARPVPPVGGGSGLEPTTGTRRGDRRDAPAGEGATHTRADGPGAAARTGEARRTDPDERRGPGVGRRCDRRAGPRPDPSRASGRPGPSGIRRPRSGGGPSIRAGRRPGEGPVAPGRLPAPVGCEPPPGVEPPAAPPDPCWSGSRPAVRRRRPAGRPRHGPPGPSPVDRASLDPTAWGARDLRSAIGHRFGSSPALAVTRVLDCDAGRRQLVAEPIRRRPIARGTGRRAGFEQRLRARARARSAPHPDRSRARRRARPGAPTPSPRRPVDRVRASIRRFSSRTRSNNAASAADTLRSSSSAAPNAARAASRTAGRCGSSAPVLVVGRQGEQGSVQPLDRGARRRQRLVGVAQAGPIVNRDEEVAQRSRGHAALEDLVDPGDVAFRPGHLRAAHLEVGAVQPGLDERLAGRRLALGDLVLVVGKDQVDATGVDVEARPRCFMLIAEHSMCQPGRPSPTLVAQNGSPASAPSRSRSP